MAKASREDRAQATAERALAYIEANRSSGWLHVVLEDGNVHDRAINDTLELCQREGDTAGVIVLLMLLDLTEADREAVQQIVAQKVWPVRVWTVEVQRTWPVRR